MRQSLLTLAFLAAGTACLNAQSMKFSVSKSAGQAYAAQKVCTEKLEMATPLTSIKKAGSSILDNKGRVVRREAGQITANYGFPVGALFYGLNDESGSYSAIRMVTDGFTDVTFNNYSNDGEKLITDVAWSWPSGSPLDNTQTVNERGDLTAQVFGSIQFPVLTAGSSTYSITTTSSTGKTVNSYWESGTEKFGVADFAISQTEVEEKPTSISNSCPQLGFYSGFKNGGSFTSNENFLTIENGAWTDTGKKLVGFAELFDKPLGLVYAKDVTVWLWAENVNTASPLNGKTLTTTIYTFGADGKMKPYATATATDADAQAVGTNGLYLISFKFMEEDPILGDVEAPIVLPEEDFFVSITGFDQLTGTFSAPFADANGDSGHGYAVLDDGSISTIPYINSPDPRVNLHIGFHAAIPLAELATPENGVAVAPVEGGYAVTATKEGKDYNDIDIYTITAANEWIVDGPDWIEGYDFDDSRLDYGVLYFFVKAAPLPEGITGRTGEVVFTLWGKQIKVTVNQGNVSTGISSAVTNEVKKSSAIYNISGQRVNKDYKGLIIKDGKKLINK